MIPLCRRSLIISALFLFTASRWAIAPGLPVQAWIVWNVGQGQWVTWAKENHCLHFDMGGEMWPKQALKKICGSRQNQLFLTHGDWDHINKIKEALSVLPSLCLHSAPLHMLSPLKKTLINMIPVCHQLVHKVTRLYSPPPPSANPRQSTNANSTVFTAGQKMLVPGDSLKAQERIWSQQLDSISKVRWLIAGHHGSHTSTSDPLLRRLPKLKQVIVSARKEKYGHPHNQVKARLQKLKIPMLQTELWGNIFLMENSKLKSD